MTPVTKLVIEIHDALQNTASKNIRETLMRLHSNQQLSIITSVIMPSAV